MGKKISRHLARYLLGITSVIFMHPAYAAQVIDLCETPLIETEPLPRFNDENAGKTQISADQTQILSDGLSRFTGNVVIEQDQLRLTADTADFDKAKDSISLSGNIHLDTKIISLDANNGLVSLGNNDRQFKTVQFTILESQLRGEAAILESDDADKSHFTRTLITSCPINKPDWNLSARNLTLNHVDAYGSAENAVFNFKGVPFFYIPYLEFPIGDKRRSGVLSPNFSSSSSRGLELSIPWYWNIAPNQDATFTPRAMTQRGVAIETQYRYLTHSSSGELDITYLGHDTQANTARHHIKYRQRTDFNTRTKLNIDFNDVSDVDYNNDFSNTFNSDNQTYLDREIALEYNADLWKTSVLAYTAETINSSIAIADRPYRQLPQIHALGEFPLGLPGLTSLVSAEGVYFDHEDNSVSTGSRFTVIPGIRYSIEGAAWHLRPSIELHHTQYDTTLDAIGNPDFTDSRTVAISSLDGGLYFERNTSSNFLQTLEPRFFYLNIPFRDQSNIPIFDTDQNDFSVGQLFRNNRFNGNDLIGDANQVSLALSSRLINPATGNELLNASIGRIFYMRDRIVTLPGAAIETTARSDIIAEISNSINHWKFEAGTQWDSNNKITEKDNLSIQYKANARNIFNLSYRKKLNSLNPGTTLSDVKHINTSFIAQISNNISLFAQWDYSLIDKRDITALGGLVYDSCCWQLSLAAKRFLLNDQNQEFDNTIMLQLSLKGFGGVSGNAVTNTLKQSIPGYTEDY